MANQLRPNLSSTNAIQIVSCRGVKETSTGLYSGRDVVSGMMYRSSLSGNPMDKFGSGGSQLVLVKCSSARSLSSCERSSQCFAVTRLLENFMLLTW